MLHKKCKSHWRGESMVFLRFVPQVIPNIFLSPNNTIVTHATIFTYTTIITTTLYTINHCLFLKPSSNGVLRNRRGNRTEALQRSESESSEFLPVKLPPRVWGNVITPLLLCHSSIDGASCCTKSDFGELSIGSCENADGF